MCTYAVYISLVLFLKVQYIFSSRIFLLEVGSGPRSSVSDAWSTDMIPSDSESTFASDAAGHSLHSHAVVDFDRLSIPTLGRIVRLRSIQ